MTRIERLNTLADLKGDIIEFKEAPFWVRELVETQGIPTGSTTFGVNTDNSDIDVVVPNLPEYRGDLFSELLRRGNALYLHESEDVEHYFQEGFSSVYVKIRGKLYNLIIPHDSKHLSKWVYATEKMSMLSLQDKEYQDKIRDKEIRVELFESYKEEV